MCFISPSDQKGQDCEWVEFPLEESQFVIHDYFRTLKSFVD